MLLGECDATGADLLARPDPDRPKIADAQDFLAEALGDGQWHPSRAIKAAAGKAEISVRTLERAVEQAGVEVESGGFPRATRWRLPSRAKPSGATVSPGPWRDCETPVATGDYEHPDSQSRHISEMAPLAPTSALSDDEERAERLAARYPEQAS